jgi:hypothetical protein
MASVVDDVEEEDHRHQYRQHNGVEEIEEKGEGRMESFIDSLSRAAADILLQPQSSLSAVAIDTSHSQHHASLSLLTTLAELACAKSPVGPPDAMSSVQRNISITNTHKDISKDDFHVPREGMGRLRPRAMSENWATEDSWKKHVQVAQTSTAPDDAGGVILPYMLDRYSAIYNKNGRIGVYSREERDVIIQRFHEKRRRRVWKKSIRYHCRKNLADSRVRVKGRFVRAGSLGENSALSAGKKKATISSSSTSCKVKVAASNMDDLLAAAEVDQFVDDDYDDDDDDDEEAEIVATSAASSFTRSTGLELLEAAIAADEDDSRLPPGKRMRRHTIV